MRLITRYKLQLALGCLLASSIPAVLHVARENPEVLGADGQDYHRLAVNLLWHHAYSVATEPPYEPSVRRPPGYPFFVATIYAFTNQSIRAVRVVQLVLLFCVAWMVFQLSSLLVPWPAAFGASCFTLLFLPLVTFVSYHLTETLAATLLTAVLILVFKLENAKTSTVVGCGLLLAALALVRPNWSLLVSLPLAVLWWRPEIQRKRALWSSVCLLLGFALPLGAWLARNCLIAQQFVGLNTQSGETLWMSSQEYAKKFSYSQTGLGWEEFKASWEELENRVHRRVQNSGRPDIPENVRFEVAMNREFKSEATALFHRTSMRDLLGSLVLRLLYLWSPNDFFSGALHAMARMEQYIFGASVIIGVWLLRTKWQLYILLFPAFYITLVHLVFQAEGRFTIPARPGLLPIAAYAVFYLSERIRGRRRAAIGLTGAAQAAVGQDADALARGSKA